jgi:hypothetical protein
MTDDRPRPKYGEYAPLPPTGASAPPLAPPPAQPLAQAAAAATVVSAPEEELVARAALARRGRDVIFTTLLLVFAVVDVITGYAQYANLADTMKSIYTSAGLGAFTSVALANSLGQVINIARTVILAVTIVVSLVLVVTKRTAFWVPVAGAVLAFLFMAGCLLAILLQDPALAQQLQGK